MTILFVGGEFGSVIGNSGGVVEDTGGSHDTNFSRCVINADGTAGFPDDFYWESATWTAQTGDFYFHFRFRSEALTQSAGDWFYLYSGTTANFRMLLDNTTGYGQAQYRNAASAWTNAGSTFAVGSNVNTHFDFHCNITTGVVKVYSAGSLAASATGLSLGHMAGVTKARGFSEVTGNYYSQLIAANVATMGMRVYTRYPNGAGANTSWTGTYTDIDETTYSDADFISAASADLVETVTTTGPSLTSDYIVKAVAVTSRTKRGASGPQNFRHVLRVNGTNYDNGSDIALDTGYGAFCSIWETDPDTGVDWLNADVASIQPGVKSIT